MLFSATKYNTFIEPPCKRLLIHLLIILNMSARKNISVKSNTHTVKPFCKVCHDAGKKESEYTNHFVKSEPGPSGVVVCPTLLNQECRYCLKKGHTVKFCSTLAQQEKNKDVKKNTEHKPVFEKKTNPNRFAALDFHEEQPPIEVPLKQRVTKYLTPTPRKMESDDFPALGKNTPKRVVNTMTGYAEMAAKKPTPIPITMKQATSVYDEEDCSVIEDDVLPILSAYKQMPNWSYEDCSEVEEDVIPVLSRTYKKKPMNWADWSDSDDE